MGQIKNIKLHIVTDIKNLNTTHNTTMATNMALRRALLVNKPSQQIIINRHLNMREVFDKGNPFKFDPTFFPTGPRLEPKPGKEYHDPWERAEAWRYTKDPGVFDPVNRIDRGNPMSLIPWLGEGAVHAWKHWHGFSYGVTAFIIAVTIEEGYNLMTKTDDGHGHH